MYLSYFIPLHLDIDSGIIAMPLVLHTLGGLLKTRVLSATLAVLLFGTGACSDGAGADSDQPSESSFDYRFDIAAQYIADAVIDDEHTQRIVLTVGEPMDTATHMEKWPQHCPPPTEADMAIPMYLDITNTSPEDSDGVMLGASLTLAADADTLTGHFAVILKADSPEACAQLIPTRDTIQESILGDEYPPTAWEVFSPPRRPTHTGEHLGGWHHYILTSIGEGAAPSRDNFFLRITPLRSDGKVDYRITQLTAANGVTGLVTEGDDKGAFFVPLNQSVSPCDTFANDTPMECGSELTAP